MSPRLDEYTQGQVTGGLFWYLAPIQSQQAWMWFLGFTAQEPLVIIARILIDLAFMIAGGAVFAVFWVETTGMGPEATARQIQNSGI